MGYIPDCEFKRCKRIDFLIEKIKFYIQTMRYYREKAKNLEKYVKTNGKDLQSEKIDESKAKTIEAMRQEIIVLDYVLEILMASREGLKDLVLDVTEKDVALRLIKSEGVEKILKSAICSLKQGIEKICEKIQYYNKEEKNVITDIEIFLNDLTNNIYKDVLSKIKYNLLSTEKETTIYLL
ncbi:MAG: hypothetical protein A2086_17280 [Spirochaetes bacterium GWD1_27_9]|nr:MAG: hypothetical protein A2Z98_12445 [Spirochaetes bacterium GWB1_27_13]OHD42474.1 MAG: hypothetical protein A2086_17280 [Spirochaetes bacterium GWD1_27_9]